MPEYTPKDMPEVTVIYDYQPEEWDRGYRVCPAGVEITDIKVNGETVSGKVGDLLIETYGDTWEEDWWEQYDRRKAGLWLRYGPGDKFDRRLAELKREMEDCQTCSERVRA